MLKKSIHFNILGTVYIERCNANGGSSCTKNATK